MTTMTIAELLESGVSLSVPEAVAVVQSLIHADPDAGSPIEEPFGPPSPENLILQADGSLTCTACAATPAVFEAAVLLQQLLDRTAKIPGGLRYALGRALLEVEAPPFDSLQEFSRSIARFENGERGDVLRALVARAGTSALVPQPMIGPRLVSTRPLPPAAIVVTERRRHGARTDQLRRELRAIDERVYLQRRRATDAMPAAVGMRRAGAHGTRWLAVVALAASLVAALGITVARSHHPSARPVADPTAATSPVDAVSAHIVPSDAPPAAKAPAVVRRPAPAPPAVDSANAPALSNVSETHQRGQDGWLAPTLDVNRRPVFSPAFASNSAAVFFHTGGSADERSALMSADSPGDQLRVMTIVDDGARNYHVQPSPDGTRVAFDSDRDGDRGVYVADRDGSRVHRVSGPGFAAVPTWSPDASRLAFVRAERDDPRVWNLWVLNLATGQDERLTNYQYGQPWSASWFPDGRRIAYTHEDRLYIQHLATGKTTSFSTPVARHLLRTPAVSPDGTRIVFQVYRNGVWLLDLRDASMRCILQDPTAEEFAWAPDGRRVAFHSRRDGQWGIYVMARKGVGD